MVDWKKIGAAVIPMSSGNTNKQIMFLQDMGGDPSCGNAIVCTAFRRRTASPGN